MKQILFLSMLLLNACLVQAAAKNGAGNQEDLATFFATKNMQEIEGKINSSPLFSGQEVPGALKAFEDAMYNIALKNKVLTTDDKIKIFNNLRSRAKGKSEELKKISSIGGTFAQIEKHQRIEDIEEQKKLGITAENLGLEYAISLDSLPGIKLFLRHGADVKKTNALGKALYYNIDDLAIAKYLASQGATLEVYVPNGQKYYLEQDSLFGVFGMNPSGQIDEKHIKVLLDFGFNINKIGYYQLPDQTEKQGTILDLAFDALDYAKKVKPTAEITQKQIDEGLAKGDKMIAVLKKYGAKRSAELKK